MTRSKIRQMWSHIDDFSRSSTMYSPFNVDEGLEEEFLSILRRCNVLPKTRSIPDTLYISENSSDRDDESTDSSISDSAHIRGKFRMKDYQRGRKRSCDYLPKKYKRRNSKRQSKQRALDDSKSPLLNSNAIHKRASLNALDVDEVWTDDWSKDEQENNMHGINRRTGRTIPFKTYTRP